MLTVCFRWARVHKTNGMTSKDAEDQILKAAKEAGLQVDKAGLDFVIDPKKKFKVRDKVLMATVPTMLIRQKHSSQRNCAPPQR
jgi:hypothetical protein